jgi:hypothetical protein
MRYSGHEYDDKGYSDFLNANAFNAHRLAPYPPESPRSNELGRAFRLIIFTLEQDPWNHIPESLQKGTPYLVYHIAGCE